MYRVLPRRWSRIVAASLIALVTFAQGVVSAHACTYTKPTQSTAGAGSEATSMHMPDGTQAPSADCMGSLKSADRSGAGGNTCHSHCQAGHQVDSTPQLGFAAPVPAPTPIVVRSTAIGAGTVMTAPQEFGVTPPPLTLLPKLLI